jgi:endonuclease YncB( thermonuclease family)
MGVFEYRAVVASDHDGDTYRVDIDQGFGDWKLGRSLRLARVSCLELWMPGGRETAARLTGILTPGKEIFIRSIKAGKVVDPDTQMSFDRYVFDVTLPDGRDLATLLVRTGWAVWWDGRTKPTPYPAWPIPPDLPQE